jgi:hypothetical protein
VRNGIESDILIEAINHLFHHITLNNTAITVRISKDYNLYITARQVKSIRLKVLRTLPYHASRYGKPRSGRSGDDRTHTYALARASGADALIGRRVLAVLAVLATRAHRARRARQGFIVYRHAHGTVLGTTLWSTHIDKCNPFIVQTLHQYLEY